MNIDGDPSCHPLALTFLKVPPGEPQRRALRCLRDVLSNHQVRELRSLIDEVDLRWDGIGKIDTPVEVKSMILQYLPLYQVFQLKRVSRTWYNVLTSITTDDNGKEGLLSWTLGSDTGLCIPDGLSTEAIASIKAEHIDAYRTGNAFSMSVHYLECRRDQFWIENVAYSAGLFAWIDRSDDRTCRVLDLRTGSRMPFVTESRSTLGEVAISGSMLAVTTLHGKCFVRSFREQMDTSFAIPSANVDRLVISGDTLVIALFPNGLQSGAWVFLITWNWKSQRKHSFYLKLQAPEPQQRCEVEVMLDREGENIVFFERVYKSRTGGFQYFHSRRTDLTGKILFESSLPPLYVDDEWHGATGVSPVQARRYATMCSMIRRGVREVLADDPLLHEARYVYYDFFKNRLMLETCPIHDLVSSDKTSFFWWEDVAYLATIQPDPNLRVIDLRRWICDRALMANTEPWLTTFIDDEEDRFLLDEEEISAVMLGDDIFQIHVFCEGITVWCFDKNIEMPNQDNEYKRIRRGNFEERIRSKQRSPTAVAIS